MISLLSKRSNVGAWRSKLIHHRNPVALGLVLLGLNIFFVSQVFPLACKPVYDGEEYFELSYNLAKNGSYQFGAENGRTPKLTRYREPAGPFLYSLPLHLFDLSKQPLDNLVSHNQSSFLSPPITPKQNQIFDTLLAVNIVAYLLSIVAVYGLTWSLGRSTVTSTVAALLIGTSPVSLYIASSFNSEVFALPFLTLHLWFFVLWFQNVCRILNAILSGFFMAALVLTKAVFLYWLILLVFVLLWYSINVFRKERTIHSILPAALFILFTTVPVGAWCLRSLFLFGDLQITGRSEVILASRAEFCTITNREYLAGYFYYFPDFGPDLAQAELKPEVFERFTPTSPRGFDSNNGFGFNGVVVRNLHIVDLTKGDPNKIKAESIRVIKKHFIKQVTLCFLIGYRAIFSSSHGGFLPRYFLKTPAADLLFGLHSILYFLMPLSYFYLTFYALSKRCYHILLPALPCLYLLGMLAGFTNGYERFSLPILPIYFVFFCLTILFWVRYLFPQRDHKQRIIQTL